MRLTDWSLRHAVTVLVLVVLIVLGGVFSYSTLPRESFPEIKIPLIIVTTFYPGVSPGDIESQITRKIETEIKEIPGIEEMSSTSAEGFSSIAVEFNPEVDLDDALQRVREKVDLARPELPPEVEEPVITDVDFSKIPILLVNLGGEFGLVRLKEIAEDIQDELETIPGVNEVEVIGGREREVHVFADPVRLAERDLGLADLVDTVRREHLTLPGGEVDVGRLKYLVRVPGEVERPGDLEDFIVKGDEGRQIYVRDVARVVYGFEDERTRSRLNGQTSITLAVKKRTGANIIEVADAVKDTVDLLHAALPAGLQVSYLGDQSKDIRDMVRELENNILSGLILVVLVLFLFLGLRNSFFVAMAIPLSLLISFGILQSFGYTLNMVILFSLILALGMLVDNAIVIVENIYRHREAGEDGITAASTGTTEVAAPVIVSTATTLCAFAPMLFWPGIIGDFMKYLPITLIITLSASLIVALIFNPTFCSRLMSMPSRPKGARTEGRFLQGYRRVLAWALKEGERGPGWAARNWWMLLFGAGGFTLALGAGLGAILLPGIASLLVLLGGLALALAALAFAVLLLSFVAQLPLALFSALRGGPPAPRTTGILAGVLQVAAGATLTVTILSLPFSGSLPAGTPYVLAGLALLLALVQTWGIVTALVRGSYRGGLVLLFDHRALVLVLMCVGLIASVAAYGHLGQGQELFPEIEPREIWIDVEGPSGTRLETTDALVRRIEERVASFADLKDYVSNVGSTGAGDDFGSEGTPNMARVTVHLIDHRERSQNSLLTLEQVREAVADLGGARIDVDKRQDGPPTGKPVSIEISGEDFTLLGQLSRQIQDRIRSVPGLVNLNDDFDEGKPELRILVDREAAAVKDVSTRWIAETVRTAVSGTEAGLFRVGEDEYDILVRLEPKSRDSLEALADLTVPDSDGRAVPLRDLAHLERGVGPATIRRKEMKRVVTIEGDVIRTPGRTEDSVRAEVAAHLEEMSLAPGYRWRFAGANQDERESREFLSRAFVIAVLLIGLVLVTQFNSVILPATIMVSVILSIIGVLWGLIITRTPFGIIMTGIGVISLAGVVVNNAIVLCDFIRQAMGRGMPRTEAVIEAGILRLRPVLLTAVTTILGLIPLTFGLALDFFTGDWTVGGESSQWWGPMGVAVIAGLSFATVLTLIVVPVTFHGLHDLSSTLRHWLRGRTSLVTGDLEPVAGTSARPDGP